MQTTAHRSFDYDMFLIQTPTSVRQARQMRAKIVDMPDHKTVGHPRDEVKALLKKKNMVLVMHYYVDPPIQDLASETGGYVGDSLEMARFGVEHETDTSMVVGVRLMDESAKIPCPEKIVLMPDLGTECSLDPGCSGETFSAFRDQYPDRTVAAYANTSAAVKARADWMAMPSVASEIVSYLESRDEKLIWGPNHRSDNYIHREAGTGMLLWQGSCTVHNELKGQGLAVSKAEYPDAVVLVHPESPQDAIELGDVIGSTSKLLRAAVLYPERKSIVTIDLGVLHEIQKQAPGKEFIAAPTVGNGGSCKNYVFCPWMAMNSLGGIKRALTSGHNEVLLDRKLGEAVKLPLQRMLGSMAGLKKRDVLDGMGPAWFAVHIAVSDDLSNKGNTMQTDCDVLTAGNRSAALALVLSLPEPLRIVILCKSRLNDTVSRHVQGGITAAWSVEDDIERYVANTLEIGAGLCDEAAIRTILSQGELATEWLLVRGAAFDQSDNGPRSTHEGERTCRRIAHAADYTGETVMQSLIAQTRCCPSIRVRERQMALNARTRPGAACGLTVFDHQAQETYRICAHHTILAGSGLGQIYAAITTLPECTGGAIAMAIRAGCSMENFGFVQLYPTGLAGPFENSRTFLISEVVHGGDSTLTNQSGERFTPHYDRRAEPAPHDIAARVIAAGIAKQTQDFVSFDINHRFAAFVRQHFPFIHRYCLF